MGKLVRKGLRFKVGLLTGCYVIIFIFQISPRSDVCLICEDSYIILFNGPASLSAKRIYFNNL